MQADGAIKINRVEGGHTHFIGRFENGNQFMLLEVYFDEGPMLSNWQSTRKEFAVLHIFNNEGLHLESMHQFAGITKDIDGRNLGPEMEALMKEKGRAFFGNIHILPFQTTIEGYAYGFIKDMESYCFTILPNEISFSAPFDGEYDI
ncbi:MAG: hypothetical protein PSX81_13360 [bacterium]|nr:hypothetical protein [bacterium]